MSRIGKKPVPVPSGVTVTISGPEVKVKGGKAELTQKIPDGITVSLSEDQKSVLVARASDSKLHREKHGLVRALIANMFAGVIDGYAKTLRIMGTGYRVELKGNALSLTCGFCAPVNYELPKGITVEIPKSTSRDSMDFIIKGVDKQLVGEVASQIRRVRPPNVYHGKGIRFAN
jgi:large subunit ribosomal protein L6